MREKEDVANVDIDVARRSGEQRKECCAINDKVHRFKAIGKLL